MTITTTTLVDRAHRWLARTRAAGERLVPAQSPRRLDEQAAAYWADSSAPRWAADSHWQSGLQEKWLAVGPRQLAITRTLLASIGRDVTAGRIVDWGCGGGANAVVLAPLCEELAAVDISSQSLEECRRQVLERTGRTVRTVLVGSAHPDRAIDVLGERSVDLIVAYYVFELLPSREHVVDVLATMQRLLVDGGAAVIQFKYDDGTQAGAMRRRNYRRRIAQTTFAVDDFWNLCEQQGLEPRVLTLVPRDELDEHYAYILLTRPET